MVAQLVAHRLAVSEIPVQTPPGANKQIFLSVSYTVAYIVHYKWYMDQGIPIATVYV